MMLCLAFFGGGATGRSPTEDLDGIDSSQPSCHGWSHFDLCSWQGHKNKEERKQLKVLKRGFSDMFDTHQKGSHPVDFIEVTNQYPISSLILRKTLWHLLIVNTPTYHAFKDHCSLWWYVWKHVEATCTVDPFFCREPCPKHPNGPIFCTKMDPFHPSETTHSERKRSCFGV